MQAAYSQGASLTAAERVIASISMHAWAIMALGFRAARAEERSGNRGALIAISSSLKVHAHMHASVMAEIGINTVVKPYQGNAFRPEIVSVRANPNQVCGKHL